MKIAELFVNMLVSNGEKAARDVAKVDKALEGTKSTALLTKAAIIGMVYGLERLTGWASQAGMDLNKFNLVTGLSTDELQKWQYVARTYDVTAEEMASTVRGLQSTITDMMLGKGMPEGAAALGIKMTRDPFDLLKQLAHAAKTLPPDVASSLIKSFGISDNVFQMLRASNLELDKLSSKHLISPREIEQLTKINKAWKDFWFVLETKGKKLVAAHGLGIVTELGSAMKALEHVYDLVVGLAKQFDSVKYTIIAIAGLLAVTFAPITTAIAALTYLLAEWQKFREGKDNIYSSVGKEVDSAKERLSQTEPGIGGIGDRLKNHKMDVLKAAMGDVGGAFARIGQWGTRAYDAVVGSPESEKEADKAKFLAQQGATAKGAPGAAPQVTVNQYGVEHPRETANETKRGIDAAFRQRAAQSGGI